MDRHKQKMKETKDKLGKLDQEHQTIEMKVTALQRREKEIARAKLKMLTVSAHFSLLVG